MLGSGEENTDKKEPEEREIPERFKQNLLDENFRKAVYSMKRKDTPIPRSEKKPFFKIGIVIFIVSMICIGIILKAPWMYIEYDSSNLDSNEYKSYYYMNFRGETYKQSQSVETFFDSENSTTFLGIERNDFSYIPKIGIYLFSILAILALVFTILVFIDKKKDIISIEHLYLFHTISMVITLVICTFMIYFLIRFFGASVLSTLNKSILEKSFTNFAILFPTPLILIFISSVLMKLCGTTIKSDFREMLNIKDEKDESSFKLNRSIWEKWELT